MSKKKKISLYIIYFFMICAVVVLFVAAEIYDNVAVFSTAITLFTTIFHFTVRIVFANLIYLLIGKFCTYDRWWFREKSFEKRLYKIVCVKKWKNFLPTWNDRDFRIDLNDYESLLAHICKAEVYHELCMVLSFVPLLFSIWWGEFWIFFGTSFVAAVFDLLFVMIQRYNRPRVMKMKLMANKN